MRILIITTQYYPSLNPNVYRWAAIAEYWANQGHEVHILCSKRSSLPNDETIQSVQVHRAGQATLLDFVYNLFQSKNRRSEKSNFTIKKTSKKRQFLEKVIDWTWRKLYWPDGSCVWYFPAKKRAIQLIKKENINAVITVGLPFTAHLIGMSIKKEQQKIKWLMDIEDPFSYSDAFFVNNFALYKRLNFNIEEKAFALADKISLTVAEAKNKYLHYFPAYEDKMFVTPPLFNLPENTKKSSPVPYFSSKGIHICYFGTFYTTVRTPEKLINLLTAFLKKYPEFNGILNLHIFGSIDQKMLTFFEESPAIQTVCHFHGLISREEVSQAIQETDFLLNIGNTTDYHLPSKSVDYLMSGKPTINLCQNTNDTFKELLNGYPLILNLHTEKGISTAIIDYLYQFINTQKGKSVDKNLLTKLSKPYLLENIAARYYTLLK